MLMTLGLMLPMAAQAQSFSDNWTLPFIAGELAPVGYAQEATSTRRAAADGVYYLRPEGAEQCDQCCAQNHHDDKTQ